MEARGGSRVALYCPKNTTIAPCTLRAVSVKADVVGCGESVVLEQTFVNDDPVHSLEALYEFVLPRGAAICEFSVEVEGGRRIQGELVPLEEAKDCHSDALASGHSSYTLAQSSNGDEVFSVSVGLLPPQKQVVVCLCYLSQLAVDQGTLSLSLPVGAASLPHSTELTVQATLTMGSGIEAISCNYPDAETSIDQGKAQATVLFTSVQRDGSHNTDDDLRIQVKLADNLRTYGLLEVDKTGSKALALTFSPVFEGRQSSEFIFLVDRSGSMTGSRIAHVRDTMQMLLRSLSQGDRFNIIGFGSTERPLFPESSVAYDDASLEVASQHAADLKADLGGTDILKPLINIMSRPTSASLSNTEECIEAVRRQAGLTRVFTFGIGQGASLALVEGLARAGGGRHEMVSGGVDIEDAVLRQLNRAMAPTATNLRIDWGGLKVSQHTPSRLPPILSGSQITIYALLLDDTQKKEGEPVEVALVGRLGPEPSDVLRLGAPLSLVKTVKGDTLHRLCAASLIRDLEQTKGPFMDAEALKAEVEDISMSYSVLSRYTAFVGVEERTEAVESTMISRHIVPVGLRRIRSSPRGATRTIVVNGRQLAVLSVSRSKTGKHGSAKAMIEAIDPETGKRVSHVLPSSQLDAAMVTNDTPEPAGQQRRENQKSTEDSGSRVSSPQQPPERNEEHRKHIRAIIMLQNAAGHWTLRDLESVPGLQQDACVAWARTELPQESHELAVKLCATVLLVAYLTLAFPDWADYWRLVVQKARKACGADVAAHEAKAAAFLRQRGILPPQARP